MNIKNELIVIWSLVTLPVSLVAEPQNLDTFYDFEDVGGSGTFTIGESPNSIEVINFTVETVSDANLTHSGSKALVLIPGNEGLIRIERGVQNLQFYAAESTGGGRLEVLGRSPVFPIGFSEDTGLIDGVERERPSGLPISLPTSIDPSTNPPLLSYVAYTDIEDTTDLTYASGIWQIKISNVSGQFTLDDIGFTYLEGPTNNTVYEDFETWNYQPPDPVFEDRTNFTIGQLPGTATFTGGVATFVNVQQIRHTVPVGGYYIGTGTPFGSWIISNDATGTITFETPAAKVSFYAAVISEGDGEIELFDTNDNLVLSTDDIPLNMNPLEPPPFTFFEFIGADLGAPEGFSKLTYTNSPSTQSSALDLIAIDDFGFTPIGAPGSGGEGPNPAPEPVITAQPTSQEVQSGTAIALSVAASGDDLTFQWYTGNSGDTTSPVVGATNGTLTTGALVVSTNFWVQVTNAGGSANSDTAVITVAAPSLPLILEGTGDIAGENIQHPNGNVFDQILLTGESIQLQARPNQITRVSFMDETEDIVQVEFSGIGSFTITLDPATFLPAALPPRYNQAVEYVTGKPSVVIDGANSSTFFSIFTVGKINAVNQALFPEGQVYDAQADVTLVEVINSTGMGGMQLSNTVFSGSKGKVGIDARGLPIGVRLTVGDIDANGDAVPHLLFGEGSFTVPANNTGLRITGGDLAQTNGAAVIVAESGSMTPGFETLISQNNFKSDNTPQPTQSIDATFINEDGDEITVAVEEVTIE